MEGKNVIFDIYTYTKDQTCRQLSPEEAALLMDECSTFSLKRGSVLYNAGDLNDRVFFLRRGTVKYHIIYPDGSSRTTAFSTAPALLGTINILPGQTASNCCTAVTACEVSVCPIQEFMKRVREHDLMEKLFFLAVGASRHIHSTLTALLSEDRMKLADILRNQQGLTAQATADIMGCSREYVSRLCKQADNSKTT